MKNAPIISIPFTKNYSQAINTIFGHFPLVNDKLKEKKFIFIAGYIDHHYSPYLYSDCILLKKLCEYIRQVNPKARIYITVNNIFGCCTRLFVNLSELRKELRKSRVRFLFLDEKASDPIILGQGNRSYRINLPRIILDKLINNRSNTLYISVSPVKTHHHVKFTGSLFHQLRLIHPTSHEVIHSNAVHKATADLYNLLKPDLTIMHAINVISHGILPPMSRIDSYSNFLNVIIGSTDSLSADLTALKLLGYNSDEITHLKLAQDNNHPSDTSQVEGEMPRTSGSVPFSIKIADLPQNLDIIIGKNRGEINCQLGLALHLIHILHEDLHGYTGFSLIVGNDFQGSQFDHIHEPIVVLGSSCCAEVAPKLNAKYHDIYYIDQFYNLQHLIGVLLKIMHVSAYNFFGTNPIYTWISIAISRLKGSKYRFPSAPGYLKKWKIQQPDMERQNR